MTSHSGGIIAKCAPAAAAAASSLHDAQRDNPSDYLLAAMRRTQVVSGGQFAAVTTGTTRSSNCDDSGTVRGRMKEHFGLLYRNLC